MCSPSEGAGIGSTRAETSALTANNQPQRVANQLPTCPTRTDKSRGAPTFPCSHVPPLEAASCCTHGKKMINRCVSCHLVCLSVHLEQTPRNFQPCRRSRTSRGAAVWAPRLREDSAGPGRDRGDGGAFGDRQWTRCWSLASPPGLLSGDVFATWLRWC